MPPRRSWGSRLRATVEPAGGVVLLAGASAGGDALARVTHAPVPGTVLGLLLILAAFAALRGVPRGIGLAARWLIQHMNLFYVPAAVGVTAYARLLRADVWPIVAALVFGTWAALAAGALTFRWVARRLETRDEA